MVDDDFCTHHCTPPWYCASFSPVPANAPIQPRDLAAVLKSLTGQSGGRVEPRPHVLQKDYHRELDQLCLNKVVQQPPHELIVDGGWRLGNRLGVL